MRIYQALFNFLFMVTMGFGQSNSNLLTHNQEYLFPHAFGAGEHPIRDHVAWRSATRNNNAKVSKFQPVYRNTVKNFLIFPPVLITWIGVQEFGHYLPARPSPFSASVMRPVNDLCCGLPGKISTLPLRVIFSSVPDC